MGDYQSCVQYYREIMPYVESIEALGFTDTLIYHHCSRQIGANVLDEVRVPTPPTKDEIVHLYNYEVSQENARNLNPRKNILVQPSILNKAVLVAYIGLKNGCVQAIETGTFLGSTSYLFSGIFDTVDTIEADPSLYYSAECWLTARRSNTRCHLGDSVELLPEIMANRHGKKLIFLDAHYSMGITSKKFGICPLLNELDIVLGSSLKNVVVIDDIRCMETTGYPTLAEIFDRIPEGRSVNIQYDQLVII